MLLSRMVTLDKDNDKEEEGDTYDRTIVDDCMDMLISSPGSQSCPSPSTPHSSTSSIISSRPRSTCITLPHTQTPPQPRLGVLDCTPYSRPPSPHQADLWSRNSTLTSYSISPTIFSHSHVQLPSTGITPPHTQTPSQLRLGVLDSTLHQAKHLSHNSTQDPLHSTHSQLYATQQRPSFGGKCPRRRQLELNDEVLPAETNGCSSCKRLKREVMDLRRQIALYEEQNGMPGQIKHVKVKLLAQSLPELYSTHVVLLPMLLLNNLR